MRLPLVTISVILIHSFTFAMIVAFFLMIFPSASVFMLFSIVILWWILINSLSDFWYFLIYRVKKERPKFVQKLVLDNYTFKNKEEIITPFYSQVSPTFLRVSIFSKSKTIINSRFIDRLNEDEINEFLQMELSYTRSYAGLLEVILRNYYLIFVSPFRFLMEKLVAKEIVEYFVGPIDLTFRAFIRSLRKSYKYKNTSRFLKQVLFKVDLHKSERLNSPVFYYSQSCMKLMVQDDVIDTTRFSKPGNIW